MFTETLTEYDDVVGIVCTGKLSEDELKSMHALLHDRLRTGRQPGLLVDLTNFEGYDSLAALREDLKMDATHRNDFSRIAVVGESKWMEWGTALAGWLTTSEMQWFGISEADAAVKWLRQG